MLANINIPRLDSVSLVRALELFTEPLQNPTPSNRRNRKAKLFAYIWYALRSGTW